MESILVAGGAGYVGSHACKALAKAGFRPITLDSLATGHADAVKWGPPDPGRYPRRRDGSQNSARK